MNNIKLCSGFGQFHSDEPTAKVRKPYKPITLDEIVAMFKEPPSVHKSEGRWVIPSTLLSRNFSAQETDGEFWALWADFDVNPKPISVVSQLVEGIIGDSDALYGSSRSATEECPKSHAFIPLGAPLSGSDYVLVQECLNDALAAIGLVPDRASDRPGQLCYLPNRGAYYDCYWVLDGKRFDPLTAFADQMAAKRAAIAAEVAEVELRRQAAEANRLQFRASGSTSAVEAFNACHTVDEVLLKAGYQQRGSHFRHPHSESGSYSTSVKNGRAYALSANDPLYSTAGAHDAFSAWAVLCFGGDQTAAAKVVYEMLKGAA